MKNTTKKNADIDSLFDYRGVISIAQIVTSSNTTISLDDVFEYEFINLGSVPVRLSNGVWLDRYYSGAPGAPTVIAGAFNRWKVLLQANERDTTVFTLAFDDLYYGPVEVVHRVLVIKKIYSPVSVPSQKK